MARTPFILTSSEVQALADYARTQSQHRTYAIVMDHGAKYVRNPDGKLHRITPGP